LNVLTKVVPLNESSILIYSLNLLCSFRLNSYESNHVWTVFFCLKEEELNQVLKLLMSLIDAEFKVKCPEPSTEP